MDKTRGSKQIPRKNVWAMGWNVNSNPQTENQGVGMQRGRCTTEGSRNLEGHNPTEN